jgi:hypothetical protein
MRRTLLGESATNIDEIVGDHAKPNPTLHPVVTFVPAAIEAMSTLGHADAPLASGSPFLTVAEPALFLLAFALSAFGGAIGDADTLDALCFRNFLIFVDMCSTTYQQICGVPRYVA